MNINCLVTPLLLVPLYAFSQSHDTLSLLSVTQNQDPEHTQLHVYSNETEAFTKNNSSQRSIDYPTQIIRMDAKIENQQIGCNEVNDQIDKLLVQNIVNDKFNYAIFISCRFDPETQLATQFIINSYFDPVNDEAISYLQSYLSQYNNSDLLGTKFKVESAKGLIISLNIAAGIRKIPYKPPFIEYRKDRSNYYFKSNYEMRNKLYAEIYQNFFTTDQEKVLPFLDKWIFSYAGSIYKSILRDSNYVELQPERIFLMDNEDIFVSGLKQYFVHYCEDYENHRCLNPAS